jgi:hypothetical protein
MLSEKTNEIDDDKKKIVCWRLKALLAKRKLRRCIAMMQSDKRADELMDIAGTLIPNCSGPSCFICEPRR